MVNYYDESAPSLREQLALFSERISGRISSSGYKYNNIDIVANEDVDQDETCKVTLTLFMPIFPIDYK